MSNNLVNQSTKAISTNELRNWACFGCHELRSNGPIFNVFNENLSLFYHCPKIRF